MANYSFFNIVGAIFSLLLYLAILFLIAFFLHDKKDIKKDYGFNVEDAIVVKLDSEPKEKPKPKPKLDPIVKPKPIPVAKPETKEVKEIKSQSPKKQESRDLEKKSAKELFADVPTDKLQKKVDKYKKEKADRESRLKKQKELDIQKEAKREQEVRKRREEKRASNLVENLNIAKPAESKKSGEYHDFWSLISDKIMAKWQRTVSTQDGLKANVRIQISDRGNLTYKILNLSNNNLFDTKLKAFLDNLTYERFPSYKEGPYIEAVFEFKDKDRGIL